jgi:hypothetical protein
VSNVGSDVLIVAASSVPEVAVPLPPPGALQNATAATVDTAAAARPARIQRLRPRGVSSSRTGDATASREPSSDT